MEGNMGNPKLSILIATLANREEKFLSLVKYLASQIGDRPVEIVALWNHGECAIGDIRQRLLESSIGEYVCFVDDDDWVPDYYIDEILAHMGEDYIGFEVELYSDGKLKPPVYHSLKYANWHEAHDGYYRNVTHLNPIRRELAIQERFDGGMGEDESWSRRVLPLVKTEQYIPRVMYQYFHSSLDSHFVVGGEVVDYRERPIIKHRCFRYI